MAVRAVRNSDLSLFLMMELREFATSTVLGRWFHDTEGHPQSIKTLHWWKDKLESWMGPLEPLEDIEEELEWM